MNNQAAQTMPELPEPELMTHLGREGYTVDQMHQYARDYAAALSQTVGVAEVGRVCKWHQQDEGYDTFSTGCGHEYTVNECTDGNVQLPYCPFCAKPLRGIAWNEDDDVSLSEALSSSAAAPAASGGESAASVSERAREMVAALYGDKAVFTRHDVARAIEQALTQQRGELPSAKTLASAVWRDWMTNEQADKLGAELHAWLGAYVATTPQPSADAMRELVERWRGIAETNFAQDRLDMAIEISMDNTLLYCADELESLLSGGSHA